METIDIQSRSFVVRWVRCSHGDTINYQIKPLKKSIHLGIYKRLKTSVDDQSFAVHIAPDTRAALDYANKTLTKRNNSISAHEASHSSSSLSISHIQQQSREIPLKDRLSASGFTLVKSMGQIHGNNLIEGALDVEDTDYYYAFILDNTSSKNVKKKVLFNASIVHGDDQSIISTRSAPSSVIPSFARGFSEKDNVLMVGKGRYIQGYLLKKRRKKLQGFKRRFFTLDFRYGTLSYYLNDHNQTRRGEIVISLSTVSANKKDRLIIIDSGMEIWALKTKDQKSWQTWVTALQSCFDNENKSEHSEEEELEGKEENKVDTRIDSMRNKKQRDSYIPLPLEAFDTFDANLKLIQQRLEQCKNDSLEYSGPKDSKSYNVFRSSSSSSVSASRKKIGLSAASPMDSNESLSSPTESNFLEDTKEHDLFRKLAELEALFGDFVKQSKILLNDRKNMVKQLREYPNSLASIYSGNEEFFDAEEDIKAGVIMLEDDDETTEAMYLEEQLSDIDAPHTLHSLSDAISSGDTIPKMQDLYPLPYPKKVTRRDDVPKAETSPPSLLSFLRKNVGKDLSSIAMPVTSNEPISILQTISETFEYASLLPQLADPNISVPPLAVVSAFAVSFLSVYRDKTRALRKPFNPLLGETFELVREDMGFRLISEKVCHKPQIFAFYAEHDDWECNYTLSPVQKYWGKSVEINNEGTLELKSKKTGEYFEWTQPTTMLKNILAGERYLEPVNEFEVISSKSGKATIVFEKTGMFGGRSENVNVVITSTDKGNKKYRFSGKWTENLKDGNNRTLWEVGKLVKNSKSKYGFTTFAANLNEMTEIEEGRVAPNDSRLRPDIRAYEQGKISEAERLKLHLEQKQRDRRMKGHDVTPQFFEKTSANKWKYRQGPQSYWERRKRQDWSGITPLW
ncbi:hypothetical protein KAFR_0D04680 [Kazachstania africana CBS 2517]|uniref:PH domain-containing protein n=1 Tax=Kazachstania africana (strain ATCC 22294 / BCRC 22015 / CBS 2517 / CECT 1963 / NBRC 1671 / NRRL Y-8276) TaxID=1071382 RepID=H2AUR6_KAZAF|nr:hypothetical protein KAFR_0D04680 [Kazachstania africana CBS 2517]CCF58116.1 hypothetical protein KAFR_0D04680 [Kazachstania africana CBS 2517]